MFLLCEKMSAPVVFQYQAEDWHEIVNRENFIKLNWVLNDYKSFECLKGFFLAFMFLLYYFFFKADT